MDKGKGNFRWRWLEPGDLLWTDDTPFMKKGPRVYLGSLNEHSHVLWSPFRGMMTVEWPEGMYRLVWRARDGI